MINVDEKSSFFSINQCTSKFMDFSSNPSGFYISDNSRTQYDIQNQQNRKIPSEIINESCHVIAPWKIHLPFNHQKLSIRRH